VGEGRKAPQISKKKSVLRPRPTKGGGIRGFQLRGKTTKIKTGTLPRSVLEWRKELKASKEGRGALVQD